MASLENRIREMDKKDLIDFLIAECSTDPVDNNFYRMSRSELVDYVIEYYYPDLFELHSECQGGDYCNIHPNETEEEFLDHEDW